MDYHRLSRPDIPADERKALLFPDEIQQRSDHLFMALAEKQELLIQGVLKGRAGETEIGIEHLESPSFKETGPMSARHLVADDNIMI